MRNELFKNIPSKVGDLVKDVRNGRIGLPDLQRPFVWRDNKVRELFDSMLKGYPIGYIMLWESPVDYESKKSTIGDNSKTYEEPKELVIDGQQRLTALVAAMFAVKVKDKNFADREIKISYNPLTREFAVWSQAYEKDTEWISRISDVFLAKEDNSISSLRRHFIKEANEGRSKKELPLLTDEEEDRIEDNINALLNLSDYSLPTLEISYTADEEDVADIFVRVNSGGQSLTENNFIQTLISVYENETSDKINAFAAASRVPAANTSYNTLLAIEPSHLIRMAVGVGFKRARLRYAYMLLRGKNLETGKFSDEVRHENLQIFKDALDSLIQTISRVNRVYTGKDKGLIVDYIGIKKNMNLALKKYTNFESDEFEGVEQSITIVKDQLDVLAQMFHNFNSTDYFNGSPKEQLACLNRAVEYVQLTEDLETRFMAAVKRMKQAFNLCSSSEAISDKEKDYLHFYCAVRSILFKLTKGDAPDISQMNARVRELLEGAIQSDGIEELFETGKHISVDIFSDEYLDKINAIQLPNTKIKVLQRLLSQAIDEYKKVNRIMGMEFSDRLKRVVDEYNNRRRDEAFANEVLDDVAEQLAKLLEELKKEKDSFKGMGIDYEEKAFYDILKAVAKKYEFEYPDDKMIELSKRIKIIVDDKAKYTDWSTRDDIKANLQVDLILLLDEFDYPPVTIDDVYKEVLEQAENFKKYAQ